MRATDPAETAAGRRPDAGTNTAGATGAPAGRHGATVDRDLRQAHLIAAWLASVAFRVSPGELCAAGRGSSSAAHARHVAMYLVHVSFGVDQGTTARLFGRHRRSVAYACARVEDSRDRADADRLLTELEAGANELIAIFAVAVPR